MRPSLLLIGSLGLGCGKKNVGTYQVDQATGSVDAAAMALTEADALWEKRGDKESLKASMAKYELVYAADPKNRDVATKLTRGWYFLGDAHATEKGEKLEHWQKAIEWGKKCIAINAEFTALLEKGDEDEATAVRVTTKDDVPCVYWTATALGKWGKLSGLSTTLKHIGTVKAYITHVTALEPTYFHGAPDRYWGAYYAAIPSFSGQDLNKSKEYLDKSIETAPDYLATRVLLAEYWAVKTQNKAAFEEALTYVINADATKIPEVTPENEAEQAKAKALLAQKDDLFR